MYSKTFEIFFVVNIMLLFLIFTPFGDEVVPDVYSNEVNSDFSLFSYVEFCLSNS